MRQPQVTDKIGPLHAGPPNQPGATRRLAEDAVADKLAEVGTGDALSRVRPAEDERHTVGGEEPGPFNALLLRKCQLIGQATVSVENSEPSLWTSPL